jgi:hypothetical protein
MVRTPKLIPKRTAGPYKIRRGEIWAVGDPLDREECLGTVYRAEGWTKGEPIRTEAQANAAFIARAMNCHDELLAAAREFDRLSLVIESAVRNEHPVNPSACGRIIAAIKTGRAAIAKAEPP